MPVKEFKLPDVGEGVAEGELVTWLVAPGDRVVEEDQPVAEVETDKALVEVPSRYDGTVEELFVEEGDIVPVGDVIISFRVGEDGEDVEAGGDDSAETGADATEPEPETDIGAETDAESDAETEPDPARPDLRAAVGPSTRPRTGRRHRRRRRERSRRSDRRGRRAGARGGRWRPRWRRRGRFWLRQGTGPDPDRRGIQ